MPRTLGYPVRPIALTLALTILGGALVAYVIHRPGEESASTGSAESPATTTVAATTVAPAPAPAPDPTIAATSPAMARGSAGMIVGIDPETGKLGLPSKTQREGLERAANLGPSLDRSDAGLTVIHKPDGSMMVDLQGRFQDYAVVRLTPDGRKIETCVQESDLEAALQGDAVPGAPAPATAARAAHSEPRHEER